MMPAWVSTDPEWSQTAMEAHGHEAIVERVELYEACLKATGKGEIMFSKFAFAFACCLSLACSTHAAAAPVDSLGRHDWRIGAVSGGEVAKYVVLVDFGNINRFGNNVQFNTRLVLAKPIGDVDNILGTDTANCEDYTYHVLSSILMMGHVAVAHEKVSGRTETARPSSSVYAYLSRVCGHAPLDSHTMRAPYEDAKEFLKNLNQSAE
jgi:hypothetical protein